jgi:acetyl esterase/lipase
MMIFSATVGMSGLFRLLLPERDDRGGVVAGGQSLVKPASRSNALAFPFTMAGRRAKLCGDQRRGVPAMTAVAKEAGASGRAYEFDVGDVTYVTHAGRPLLAQLYRPRGAGPFPIMIDLHGGAWCNGDRTNDKVLCEALARSGVVVAAIDFRMPPDAGYPASLADVNFAVRWARANAAGWNGRPDRIGLIGISSGGHQAMLAAMRPDDSRYGAVSTEAVPAGSADVQCVVLCWPVIDPLGRYR